jgi:hypothetical protein
VKQRVKQISETRDETYGETTNETCKRKIKNNPEPTDYIHGMWQIITLVQLQLVAFGLVLVFFLVLATRPSNTRLNSQTAQKNLT